MSELPRIVVLFGNIPLLGNELANIETIDQLRQRGSEVLFLIRREWTTDTIQKELDRRALPFLFVPYYRAIRFGLGFGVWTRNIYGIIGGSWALLRQIRLFRATHLHVGTTDWVLNFLPALMISRLPLVYRACDLPARHHALWRWVWKYTCKRAAVFVCDSRFIRDSIVAMGAPHDRCEVIHSPAPSRAQPALVMSKESVQGPLTVLYVGQISSHKGVDLLVTVAQRLISEFQIRFVIVGDYSWKNPMGQALVQKVRDLELQDRIIFTGYANDIEALYAQADLHVAPSVWDEPYGITVVEAKHHGLPSIVFPSGGLLELVEHGCDGWICADRSAKSLEVALRHYLRNPTIIIDQGRMALASLNKRLHLHEYGERWARIYGLP